MITAIARTEMEENIQACCKSLFLTSAIPELIKEDGTPKQIEYLAAALQKEVARREENKRERLVKRARFPVYKTFDGYEYRCIKLPPALSKEDLEAVRFIEHKHNLVLYGPVGIGKTHMAIAVGVNACRKGYKVRFYTVTELVLKLAEARKNGTLERLRSDLNSLDLLILDEWGYVPVDRDGSQLLFRVISDSYESKSLILTTNLEFSKWGSIFTDDQMAAAMIDRLVHHGHLLLFEGNSYRMEHALMKQTARQPRVGTLSRDRPLDVKRTGSP
jgi:DNA replication protein DnaC